MVQEEEAVAVLEVVVVQAALELVQLFLLQQEQVIRLLLVLEVQQVQAAMVALEEIQYFQPLLLQAVVMEAVLILLAVAEVRVRFH